MQLRSRAVTVAASVVISDLYIERISSFPDETDPPLVIDPDAVFTCTIFLKGFEMVTTIDRQHPELGRGIQHQQLTASRLLDRLKSDYGLIVEDGFGVRVLERAYRHYAKDMTQCIRCQASCPVSPRVAPRRVRALRNWLMAQLRQSLPPSTLNIGTIPLYCRAIVQAANQPPS